MEFIYIQIVVFITIILSSIIGGKKAVFIAGLVWSLQTYITYRFSSFNYLQIITLGLAFQIGLIVAVIRDLIVKKIKFRKTKENV